MNNQVKFKTKRKSMDYIEKSIYIYMNEIGTNFSVFNSLHHSIKSTID